MSRHSSSSLFLIGMIALCSIWVTFPFWRPEVPARPEASPRPTATPDGDVFRYRIPVPTPDPTVGAGAPEMERQRLARQLDRRARMERDGVRRNIIDNPDMPEEVRSRFRTELERLDMIAESHPEEADRALAALGPRKVGPDGGATPEFEEVVRLMRYSGAWDDLSDDYVRQLVEASRDPDLPEDRRPTSEEIDAARRGRHIPTL